MKRKTILNQFIFAVCSLFISSACILFVPLVYCKSNATLICSAVFWAFLAIGYALIFIIHRKKKQEIRHKIAIITFFRNPPAKVADIILMLSIAATIIIGILKFQIGYGQYFLFFIIVFSFHMHSFFNSYTYRFIQCEVRRVKE